MGKLKEYCSEFKAFIYELFVVVRKNMAIRSQRYVTFTLELLIPIIIVSVMVRLNVEKSLLRAADLEQLKYLRIKNANKSLLESSYSLGRDYTEEVLVQYVVCSNKTDSKTIPCLLGYVADDDTERAIFTNPHFMEFFHNETQFIKFETEKAVENCIKNPMKCPEFDALESTLPNSDLLFNFRGAVVFSRGINENDVTYKIRLLERYFGSLKHIILTAHLYPSATDKQKYVRPYVVSGFLGLQFLVDRFIIGHIKRQSGDNFVFGPRCQCFLKLHEMPHRATDSLQKTDEEEISEDARLLWDYLSDPEGSGVVAPNVTLNLTHLDDDDDSSFSNAVDVDEFDHSHVVKSIVTVKIMFVLSFLFIVPSEQRRIVSDKDEGLIILLLITGMTHRTQWLGNLMSCVLSYFIPTLIVAILSTITFNTHLGALFEMVSVGILWLFLLLYVTALASTCYFMTIFFDKPVNAIITSTSVLVLSYVAPVYYFELTYDTSHFLLKLLSCLHPSFALQIALKILIRFEELGVETHLYNLGDETPTDSMRLIYVVLMLIFDTVVYMTLTIYFGQVVPSKHGVNKPWYYVMTIWEWKADSGKNNSISYRKTEPGPLLTLPNTESQVEKAESEAEPAERNAKRKKGLPAKKGKKADKKTPLSNNSKAASVKGNVSEGVPSKDATIITIDSDINKDEVEDHTESKLLVAPSLTADPTSSPFEEYHGMAEPSIVTQNLSYTYTGSAIGLSKLNMKFYHGEIFVLLGANGSGKSTLLNIFSGFTKPTSGTAFIFGKDITKFMVQIQADIGICLQRSLLYEDLSPLEHLMIFGALRGLRGQEATDKAAEIMERLRIMEVRNLTSRKLSKGDKRKLNLAIALIGDPKIILLDEPTGGMDYYSRRAVWDVLLKIREDHTIIMSTQFMDEAELLGDRIGIMAKGEMRCCGSAHFLRRHFGLGYSLKLRMNADKVPDKESKEFFLDVVQQTVPNATLIHFPNSPHAHRLVAFNIPAEGYSTQAMTSIFEDLTEIRELMGIRGFYMSPATLDEVFLALSKQLNPNQNEETTLKLNEGTEAFANEGKSRRCIVPLLRLWILWLKRVKYQFRRKTLSIFQIVFPLVIACIAMIRMTTQVIPEGRSSPSLEITLTKYWQPTTLYHHATRFDKELLNAAIGNSAKYTQSADIAKVLIHINDPHDLRRHYIVAVLIESSTDERRSNISLYFSTYKLHSSPLAVNIYSNILVKKMDKNRRIKVSNHPLHNPLYLGPYMVEDPHAPAAFAMLSSFSSTSLIAFMMVFPIEERFTEVKHLQMMTGLSSLTYWLALFIWDMMVVMFALCMTTLFSITYPPYNQFALVALQNQTIHATVLLFFSYTLSTIFMMYLFSHFTRSVSGGFSLVIALTFLCGILLPFLTVSLGAETDVHDEGLLWVFRLIPIYSISVALRKYARQLSDIGNCNHFTALGEKYFCDPGRNPFVHSHSVSCCANCPEIEGGVNCTNRDALLVTPTSRHYRSYQDRLEGRNLYSLSNLDAKSIVPELICLLCTGIFFVFLVIFLDSDTYRYITACVYSLKGRAFQTDIDDDDILDENEGVDDMVSSKNFNDKILLIHKLSKTYGIFPAVQDVSLGIDSGECLGILGINGAGKSTLFQLISAATTETYGNVYSGNCSLTWNRRLLMAKMGYAPHHALSVFEYLSPRENLKVFANLKGLTSQRAKKEIDEILTVLNLREYADKLVRGLDGGIRRRLCLGISVIGKPPILLFDDPTSIADPASWRLYWEFVKGLKSAGHTIFFNSHRVTECEALCDRISILIDGKFQCIGTPTHLKDKFGRGYKLIVKLHPGQAANQGYVSSLSENIVRIFNPCTLRDRRRNMIQFVIHNATIAWDFLFKNMEVISIRYNDLVEDYSFSETTFEEIFLSFVIFQHCGRKPDTTTCSCKKT